MVFYIQGGDIFKIPQLKNYAHGCNCAGAMGKGIALQFRNKFPKMYEHYKNICKKDEFHVGEVFKYDYDDGVIFNLGTQRNWTERAHLEFIGESLHKMMVMALDLGIKDIAMPAIGAGLGGCPWDEVKKLISKVANEYPSVNLYVIEQYKDIEINIVYIKKRWEEDNITYYLHFIGEEAVRQIEVHPKKTLYLSIEKPISGNSLLYDQKLQSLKESLEKKDYITGEEFEDIWSESYSSNK